MRNITLWSLFLCVGLSLHAQHKHFTIHDTLRGSITPERAWWDLVHYDLHVQAFPKEKRLSGHNTITFRVLESRMPQVMQIDLQPPLFISQVSYRGKSLRTKRFKNVFYVYFDYPLRENSIEQVTVHYQGVPVESKNPPWSGGVTWKKDESGKNFIATSCQGMGASVWWPCKDHMYDEPDSMDIHLKTPKGLVGVANGILVQSDKSDSTTNYFHWKVVNPINNYGVNMNIGNYVNFGETYQGLKGDLSCEYWVLKYNEEKARKQFKQVAGMLDAFEHWFGPYPFYEDGFKVVEVPYLGMEHQSSITYGNGYMNGYLGRDLSGSGWGMKFDYIIIHEAGHEWFANNITYKDIADMWIHEAFTTYSEALYVEYHFGKEAGAEYVRGQRRNIRNDKPIIAAYGVNQRGSGDMYFKGANMLHMIRKLVNDDEKWRNMLIGLNKTFYHQTVMTKEIEAFMIRHTRMDLLSVFDQYLRAADIPELEYYTAGNKIIYRWNNCIDNFNMPVDIQVANKTVRLYPTQSWNNTTLDEANASIKLHPDFLATLKRYQQK